MPERHSSESHDDSASALNPRPAEETTKPVTPRQPPQPQLGASPPPGARVVPARGSRCRRRRVRARRPVRRGGVHRGGQPRRSAVPRRGTVPVDAARLAAALGQPAAGWARRAAAAAADLPVRATLGPHRGPRASAAGASQSRATARVAPPAADTAVAGRTRTARAAARRGPAEGGGRWNDDPPPAGGWAGAGGLAESGSANWNYVDNIRSSELVSTRKTPPERGWRYFVLRATGRADQPGPVPG